MDCLTPEQRHKNMVNIKSKDTSIEVVLRKALWKKGIRYRKNYKLLPGTPDIAITKYKIAIFCDSEFFHGKDWEVLKPRLEKGKNAEFWIKKMAFNRLVGEREKHIERWNSMKLDGTPLEKIRAGQMMEATESGQLQQYVPEAAQLVLEEITIFGAKKYEFAFLEGSRVKVSV